MERWRETERKGGEVRDNVREEEGGDRGQRSGGKRWRGGDESGRGGRRVPASKSTTSRSSSLPPPLAAKRKSSRDTDLRLSTDRLFPSPLNLRCVRAGHRQVNRPLEHTHTSSPPLSERQKVKFGSVLRSLVIFSLLPFPLPPSLSPPLHFPLSHALLQEVKTDKTGFRLRFQGHGTQW